MPDAISSVSPTQPTLKREHSPEKESQGPNKILKTDARDEEFQYKLKISNLALKHTKKILEKHILETAFISKPRIKKAPSWKYCFLSLDSQVQQQQVFDLIAGSCLPDGTTIECEIVPPRLNNSRPTNQKAINEDEDPAVLIANQVTPLWASTYPDQLIVKKRLIRKCLDRVKKKLQEFEGNKNLSQLQKDSISWINDHDLNSFDLVASPLTTGYRTKCEFTFGTSSKGEPTLGFLLGQFKNGLTAVEGPSTLQNVSEKAKLIVSNVQSFLRTSTLSVFDKTTRQGFWRLLQVRTQSIETMLILQVNPSNIPKPQIDSELQLFKESLNNLDITTILIQYSSEMSSVISQDGLSVLHGPGYIQETLSGIKFTISPLAFFQVNTGVAELLFDYIKTLIKEDSACDLPSLLLDLCCGTGTISQLLCSSFDRSIGVDIVHDAIVDAKRNAIVNGLDIEYVCGKVEDCLKSVLSCVYGDKTLRVDEITIDAGVEVKAEISDIEKKDSVAQADLECAKETTEIEKKNSVAQADSECTKETSEIEKKDSVAQADLECAKETTSIEKKPYQSTENLTPNYKVTAILDPPRAGVHVDVIRSIRKCTAINKVIYVACACDLAQGNFVDLCRPETNKFKGKGFKIGRIIGFDMFPSTKQFELVIEFIR